MAFQKAVKTQRQLRMALFGPSGSGKTYTALQLATHLVAPGQRIALVDTERSSASLYAEQFDFDVCSLTRYGVDDYLGIIREAEQAGYGFLVIDSLSHAWEGPGGILERVEDIKRQKRYSDSMRAWADIKPEENRLWDGILDAKCSIIATMRSKTAYEIDKDDKGKLHVEKLGLAPIQRADKEYEFDLVGRMETDNTLVITKSRCAALSGGVYHKPNGNVSAIIKDWLGSGAPAPAPAPTPTPATQPAPADKPPSTRELWARAKAVREDLAIDGAWYKERFLPYLNTEDPRTWTAAQIEEVPSYLRAVDGLQRVITAAHLDPADVLEFLRAHFDKPPCVGEIANLTNALQTKEDANV